jgi:calcium-activated chloride channel regulator 4
MMKRKFFFYFFMLIGILFSIQPAFAGSNALTRFDYDDAGNGYFDLVVSLDWQPTQEEIDGTLQTAFNQFACDVFTMTEGHHRVRNLYVYTDGQQMNTADIRISNEVGRSSAYVNGIFQKGARILAYMLFEDQNPRYGDFLGHTLAHEFAHYAYGLFDEYTDAMGDPNAPLSQPKPDDTTKETIMANQSKAQWFSTSYDYSQDYCKDQDMAQCRNTAQWRVYQSSAWETLVRNPNDDPTLEEWKAAYNRIGYDDFIQMEEEPLELSRPKEAEGCRDGFNVIYKQGNVAVLVIDRSGSMRSSPEGSPTSAMDLAKSAAQQFVDLMNVGDRVAVVDFSNDAATTIGITELTDVGARTTVKNGIAGLTAGGQTNFSAALNQALTVLLDGSSSEQTRYVVMLSDGDYNLGGPPNLQPYIENEIPIYTIGLNVHGGGEAHLQTIADETGATYRAAPTALDLADLYAEINRDIQGTTVALTNQNDQLANGQVNEMETIVSDQDHVVNFRASWEQGDSMEFVVIDPNGTEYTATSLPQGASYAAGSDYGVFTFNNPMPGRWVSRLTAVNDARASGQISQEASAESPLSVQLDLAGGNYPMPISIMATVTGPEPVVGADVSAIVTSVDDPDQTPLAELTLKDDGETPDLIPNDGVYSGVYPNYSADGDYAVTVDVNNSSQTATLDTSGALEPGKDAAPIPLSDFSRHIEGKVTVSGYTEPPSDAASAQETELDNKKNWGIIDSAGAVRWYQFTAEAGQQYFISTSNLLSWDDAPLATNLTLYESDATTIIDSSANYKDHDVSMIKWTPKASGTYYVSVSADGGGTGNFALTIGTVDIVTPTIEANDQAGTSGGSQDNADDSSSGGCFVNTITRSPR